MKNSVKRIISLTLSLAICLSLFFGLQIPTQAATVNYVYSGKYILNWGVRETVATFLSPNAEAFYDDNNVTYEELAELSGSSSESSVPYSALYLELQDLMESNHSYIISYDNTRDKFQYTDCENSGKTSKKISSFYSGDPIGPAWDGGSTWNREHTWPNSKGDMAGNGENDIMMLRPAATSENGSRSNKAYGEGSSYYYPNTESNDAHDVRGDVARIILYQYVRWGCTNTGSKYNPNGIFGTNGVIESKTILLDWIEEDPVDTWELGRNDSVESITGTRNVFVDYPEFAFLLFDEEIPSNYQTPSGNSAAPSYKVSSYSNNTALGTVSVSDNIITAKPTSKGVVSGYTIVSGSGTVVRNGNTFTVTPTSDITVRINFSEIEYTVSAYSNDATLGSVSVSNKVITATPAENCLVDGYTIVSGSATVAQNGNVFTVTPSSNVTICINFVEKEPETITGTSNNLTWTLKGTVLTISGKGTMVNYTKTAAAPWGTDITEVIIEDGVKSIGNRAFFRCEKLEKVTIADSVIYIGNNAFFRCSALETIDLPENLTGTGSYVFRYSGLKEIIIPEKLTKINTGMFDSCESLECIMLPATLKTVSEYAFLYNSSLTTVLYDSSERYQNFLNIAANNGRLKKATWYGNGITVGATLNVHWALEDSGKLTIYGQGSMANYPKNMGIAAPWGTDITELVIEDGVTHIGHRAFFGCSKLEKVTIGNSVVAIGNNAFNGCELLTNVVIPDSVIRLDNTVFENCKALTEITLSKNIEKFGIYCFTGSGLKTVYYNGTEEDRANIKFDVGNNKIKKTATWVYGG